MWAPRYWPKVGAEPAVGVDDGSNSDWLLWMRDELYIVLAALTTWAWL